MPGGTIVFMTDQMMKPRVDGRSVQRRRLELGYSRERLAVAADGIGAATVFRIEHELVHPRRVTVAAVARALRCAPDDLLTNVVEPADNRLDEKARVTARNAES